MQVLQPHKAEQEEPSSLASAAEHLRRAAMPTHMLAASRRLVSARRRMMIGADHSPCHTAHGGYTEERMWHEYCSPP